MNKIQAINCLIEDLKNASEISDGYHTFCELYSHRNWLFIKLCKMVHETEKMPVWRSVYNAEGKMEKGWFILGMSKTPGTQLSYHLPIEFWDETMFAETLERALHDDKYTPKDVLQRIATQI